MFGIEHNLEKNITLSNPDSKSKLDMFLNHAQKYFDDGIFERGNIRFKHSYSSKKKKYIDIQFLIKIRYISNINKEYLTFLTELNQIVDYIGYDLVIQQFTDFDHTVNHNIQNSVHFKIKV